MISRREFVKIGALVGAGVMLPLEWVERAFAFNLLGQTLPLNPMLLTKYVDPLPVMSAIDATGGGTFADPSAAATTWSAPAVAGAFTVKVTVTNAGGASSTRSALVSTVIARRQDPLAAAVRCANYLPRGNATAGPDHGIRLGPMIATRHHL